MATHLDGALAKMLLDLLDLAAAEDAEDILTVLAQLVNETAMVIALAAPAGDRLEAVVAMARRLADEPSPTMGAWGLLVPALEDRHTSAGVDAVVSGSEVYLAGRRAI